MSDNLMPVAVLGGSGFIGTHLVGRMIEKGLNPRIGDSKPSTAFPERHFPCDVRSAESLRGVLAGTAAIINLAAEHRDDIYPTSRYHETNVVGASQVCRAATEAGVNTIIFTSSVAVYGFQPFPVDESGPFEPFNPYGLSKLLAEGIYQSWAAEDTTRSLVIIRPAVVFGEGNRGNVFNLLRQIATGRFMMVGPGTNRKSMAYVGNVAEVLRHSLILGPGIHVFNYVDLPDMNMNELVAFVNSHLGRPGPIRWRVPLQLAMLGGFLLDVIANTTGKTLPISAIRVRKFCESTQFKAERIKTTGFIPLMTIHEALAQTIQTEFNTSKS